MVQLDAAGDLHGPDARHGGGHVQRVQRQSRRHDVADPGAGGGARGAEPGQSVVILDPDEDADPDGAAGPAPVQVEGAGEGLQVAVLLRAQVAGGLQELPCLRSQQLAEERVEPGPALLGMGGSRQQQCECGANQDTCQGSSSV